MIINRQLHIIERPRQVLKHARLHIHIPYQHELPRQVLPYHESVVARVQRELEVVTRGREEGPAVGRMVIDNDTLHDGLLLDGDVVPTEARVEVANVHFEVEVEGGVHFFFSRQLAQKIPRLGLEPRTFGS